MQARWVLGSLSVLAMLALLAACTPAAPTATPTPMPAATAMPMETQERPVSGKIGIGGRGLYYVCSGHGKPAVIVEAGAGAPGASDGAWNAVVEGVAVKSRICVYDRARLGKSDQVRAPRAPQDVITDLHTLLVKTGVGAPYVLVGHSMGGIFVRQYAADYPGDVVGMVLVDSSHPDDPDKLMALLPKLSAGEPTALTDYRDMMTAYWDSSSGKTTDGLDMRALRAQAHSLGSLGDLPLIVLTRSPGWAGWDIGVPVVDEKLGKLWQELQVELPALSSASTQIVASKAGHDIHVDEPQLVLDAILDVVEQARKRGE